MASSTEKQIEEIIEAADRAERNCDFVDSIRMQEQQITGTRYKFILTEYSPER